VAEFRRVIRYPRLERKIAMLYRGVVAFEREYERLLSIISIDGVAPGVLVPDDRDDEVFVRTAIAARAGFIVTRDPDLLVLKKYEAVLIVTPEEFMRAWHAASGARPAPARKWWLPWRRK
jgi:predicted nucleic acid-binding protein